MMYVGVGPYEDDAEPPKVRPGMTKQDNKERLTDSGVAADEVSSRAEHLRARLQAAIDAKKALEAPAPRMDTQVSGLFSSNVGDEVSEDITPDEMATPFPDALLVASDSRMNATMFRLPSLGDSEVSSGEGLEQPSRVDTRMVSDEDIPADLFVSAGGEWGLEPSEEDAPSSCEVDPRVVLPTCKAASVDGRVLGSPTVTEREGRASRFKVSSGNTPAAVTLAESGSSWAVEDIVLDGELPGDEPAPPAFDLGLEPERVTAPSMNTTPVGPAPADAEMGGPGVYIHRKVSRVQRTRDSGLQNLSSGDLDELFSSSAPELRRRAARKEHRTPGAMGVSVAGLAAGILPKEEVGPSGQEAAEAPLECSLMFSRGGEPVSSVAVDEGFIQALMRFALDYAKARSH